MCINMYICEIYIYYERKINRKMTNPERKEMKKGMRREGKAFIKLLL